MLEQEFDNLLAGFFENKLSEEELILFHESVQNTPAYQRRFQRELRLHTLMRDEALVILQDEDKSQKGLFGGKKFSSVWLKVAAVVLLSAVLLPLLLKREEATPAVGHCLHVSARDDLRLWRDGKIVPVESNTELLAGDRIESGFEAKASFRLGGVGVVSLQSNTELVIFPADDDASVSVERGAVMVEAEKRKPGTPPAILRTPKAEVKVMGTVFGLEVNAVATRVQVHEGLVRFSNRSSKQSVDVEEGQFSVNGGDTPKVYDQEDLSPGDLLPGQVLLLPVDDACADRGKFSNGRCKFSNGRFLKVEAGRRTSYLKFAVPEGGDVLGAKLRLTQLVDPGGGKLRVSDGSHHKWSEQSISAKSAPKPLREVSRRNGWVSLNQVIELDVLSLINKGGTYTLVVTLDGAGANDIWFGSKESPHPPELVITRQVR